METAASSSENDVVRPTQMIGLLLWRGGWILVLVWLLVEAARWMLRFVELPVQLEVGFGLILAGGLLVVVSLVLERIRDARGEGDLSA